MAQSRLDQILETLSETRDDFDARHDILTHGSLGLLRHPALGGQLAAKLCASGEDDPDLEDLCDLLAAALNAVRQARESGRKRGDVFLTAIEEAVELAAKRGTLNAFHRILLAGQWAKSGLTAPAVLEWTEGDLKSAEKFGAPTDPAALDEVFDEIAGHAKGDALLMHTMLAETFPAMAPPVREMVVRTSVSRPEPMYAQLACFWLIDPSPDIRHAAADGLAARLDAGLLTTEITTKLTVLRTWMPDDETCKRVDRLLRDALRSPVAAAAAPASWTVQSVLASLPDGGGAQSFAVPIRSGKSRSVAMALVKQGHGVKDAYIMPCKSASDQKAFTTHMAEETGALSVPLEYLQTVLSMAMGDGLAQGLPPAPGLVDVASLCGLTNLRPGRVDTESLLKGLDSFSRVSALSAKERKRLIDGSADWWERHEMVQEWFEEDDDAHEALDKSRGPQAAENALWKWLDTRRDWWTRQIAVVAALLEAADHADADGFTATALALLEGRNMKNIPIMADVHEQTIEARVLEDMEIDLDESLEDPEAMEDEPPKPERKGEFAKMLKGSPVSPDWIDGFLLSIVISPKRIAPDRWFPKVLEKAELDFERRIDPQRFLDIVMMRGERMIETLVEEGAFDRWTAKLPKRATRDWAAGFSHGHKTFKSSWPAKPAGTSRAVQRMISAGVDDGLGEREFRVVGQWMAALWAAKVAEWQSTP